MKKLIILLLVIFFTQYTYGNKLGIYEKVITNAKDTPAQIAEQLASALKASDFTFLNKLEISTPNLVREGKTTHSPFQAFLLLATSPSFDSLMAKYGNRYAANWLLRIGVYQDEHGSQVQIANIETITRVICNDLPDKDYIPLVHAAKLLKNELRKLIVSTVKGGKQLAEQMPPLRSEKRLRQAKKDMLMMVGPMTYFKDRDQFPILREVAAGNDAAATFARVLAETEENIKKFTPSENDANYHWSQNPDVDLKWRITCVVKQPGINAALIGISRNRTEALSFHICGMKRETKTNSTPGIDHVTAFPIEVVIFEEDGKIKIGTAREMFRMDMYFWDAGKWAFMKYMNMPGMLDKSIKKAVTGI